jgi:DNA polymerase (family 10)
MPVHNSEIADIFNQMADLLEIQGANEFRVRAYRTAARNISNLPDSVASMVQNGEDLAKLPGLGKDLAKKAADIVRTGTLSQLEELKRKTPGELTELMHVSGLGPRKVRSLFEELDITTLDELRKAAKNGNIRNLKGFGAKTEEAILNAIEEGRVAAKEEQRVKLSVAEDVAESLLSYLWKVKGVKQVEAAGSYRRRQETIGDLDVLAVCKRGKDVMDSFLDYEDVAHVVSSGETKSSVVLRSGLQVDLRVVPEVSYGAALAYFTGSKAHSIRIRKLGVGRGLKINEYGVFKRNKRVAGKNESDIYNSVGLPYIVPELREDRGEVEAGQNGDLPELITLEDIRGDLHAHTKATDGHSTLEEMARAAQEKGYEYLAITEHSRSVTVAGGLNAKGLSDHIKEIDRLNRQLKGFVLLKSIEVDILEDGSLDLPDDILVELDLVVGAVHSKFGLSQERQTDRLIKAMENPHFSILAHPTGRMINQRPPYDLDMDRLMKAAADSGCTLELNAQPERLDLTDVYCKMAKETGVRIAISTDAHSTHELTFIHYGVYQARRGWLSAADVVNTRGVDDLKQALRQGAER